MADEADELDNYMADLDRFLHSELNGVSKKRPSKSREDRDWKVNGYRKMEAEQHKKTEEAVLKEGLGAAIPSSNLGFRMLQQMGYTPGSALGKHGQGILEPVNVGLKRGKTGLGRDEMEKQQERLKAKIAELESARQKRTEKELRYDFQERRKSSWQTRKIGSQYSKATATLTELEHRCRKSDGTVQREGPVKEGATEASKQEEEEEEVEITMEMLESVLDKLRTEFHYCFFCGVQYDSQEALAVCCPGLTEEDH